MSNSELQWMCPACLTCLRDQGQFHSCLCLALVCCASACLPSHDLQRDTYIDGLLKDVSALITGLPGLVLVLTMLRNNSLMDKDDRCDGSLTEQASFKSQGQGQPTETELRLYLP
jgi:hypothetical protein